MGTLTVIGSRKTDKNPLYDPCVDLNGPFAQYDNRLISRKFAMEKPDKVERKKKTYNNRSKQKKHKRAAKKS